MYANAWYYYRKLIRWAIFISFLNRDNNVKIIVFAQTETFCKFYKQRYPKYNINIVSKLFINK